MKMIEDYMMFVWGLFKYLSNKYYWKGVKGDFCCFFVDGLIDFEEYNWNLWIYVWLIFDSNVNYGMLNLSLVVLMDDILLLIMSCGFCVIFFF